MSDQNETIVSEEQSRTITPVPPEIAVLPLRDTVLFPHAFMPLAVARESSVRLIDEAVASGKMIAVFAQRDAAEDNPQQDDLYPVGTASHIHKMFKLPDGSLRIIVQGLARVRLDGLIASRPYLLANVSEAPEQLELEAAQHVRVTPFASRPERAKLAPHESTGSFELGETRPGIDAVPRVHLASLERTVGTRVPAQQAEHRIRHVLQEGVGEAAGRHDAQGVAVQSGILGGDPALLAAERIARFSRIPAEGILAVDTVAEAQAWLHRRDDPGGEMLVERRVVTKGTIGTVCRQMTAGFGIDQPERQARLPVHSADRADQMVARCARLPAACCAA